MRILVTGATGFIGQNLVAQLLRSENEVTVVSRNPKQVNAALPKGCAAISWDQLTPAVVHQAEAVINLAGESVAGKRWSSSYKQKILSSRVQGTRKLVECINDRPKNSNLVVFISASAVGYYGDRGATVLDPESTPGDDFLAQVCVAWEAEAQKARHVRVVIPRIGMVLGPDGGALLKMLPIFKLGLGGELGDGLQWMSWIHIQDLVDLFEFFLNDERAQGAFNAVAPYPVTNKEFTKDLASILETRAFVKSPAFLLKVAFGEMSALFLNSQRSVPTKTLGLGFCFKYPTLTKALENLSKNSAFRQFFPQQDDSKS